MNGTSKGLVGVLKDSTSISSIFKGVKLVWSKQGDIPINELILEINLTKGYYFYLPISATSDVTGSIDWGDGKSEQLTLSKGNSAKYHYYQKGGTYTVTFTLTSGEYVFTDSICTTNSYCKITKVNSLGEQYHTSFKIQKANSISVLPKNYPFKDNTFILENDDYDGAINVSGLFSKVGTLGDIRNCNFTRLEGDMFKGNDTITDVYSKGIYNCPNLEYIENLNLPNYTSVNKVVDSCSSLITVNKVTIPLNHGSFAIGLVLFGNSQSSIRKMTITNLSDYEAYDIIKLSDLTNWGVNSTAIPDAKKSLIDSLITNTTIRSKTLSLYLSDNTKAALTSSEKAQITNKGFTIV